MPFLGDVGRFFDNIFGGQDDITISQNGVEVTQDELKAQAEKRKEDADGTTARKAKEKAFRDAFQRARGVKGLSPGRSQFTKGQSRTVLNQALANKSLLTGR